MAESEFKPRMETSGKGPHLSEAQFFVWFSLFFGGGGCFVAVFNPQMEGIPVRHRVAEGSEVR